MTDVLQIAEQRRADYKAAIAKREREIEELHKRIAELNDFLKFGQMLAEDKTPKLREPTERNHDSVSEDQPGSDTVREHARPLNLERTPSTPHRSDGSGLSSVAGE